MQWKDLAERVGRAAPLVGSLLGGPAGATVGAIVTAALGVENAPEALSAACGSPEVLAKIREIESQERVQLQQLAVTAEANRLAAETAGLHDVNATMQAEAASSHWPTYSWRPAIGFAVALNTIASSLVVLLVFSGAVLGMPEAAKAGGELPGVLGALAAINGTVLPILGIASYFRGKMQADPGVPSDNRG